jgi:hypothetical protein
MTNKDRTDFESDERKHWFKFRFSFRNSSSIPGSPFILRFCDQLVHLKKKWKDSAI